MNPYFFSSEKECIDIDECTGEPCAEMEECVNNDGGFQCKCAQEEWIYLTDVQFTNASSYRISNFQQKMWAISCLRNSQVFQYKKWLKTPWKLRGPTANLKRKFKKKVLHLKILQIFSRSPILKMIFYSSFLLHWLVWSYPSFRPFKHMIYSVKGCNCKRRRYLYWQKWMSR